MKQQPHSKNRIPGAGQRHEPRDQQSSRVGSWTDWRRQRPRYASFERYDEREMHKGRYHHYITIRTVRILVTSRARRYQTQPLNPCEKKPKRFGIMNYIFLCMLNSNKYGLKCDLCPIQCLHVHHTISNNLDIVVQTNGNKGGETCTCLLNEGLVVVCFRSRCRCRLHGSEAAWRATKVWLA